MTIPFKVILAMMVLLSVLTARSQSTAVTWSGFNIGFATTASVTTTAQSVAGQLVVGSSQSSNTAIGSGFLSGTFGPPAVTATFTVTTASDSVVGSLRWATQAANATVGLNVINFDIPGSGVHTIALASPLPIFTDPVIIDGYSQPGSTPNTNAPELGSNAVLCIDLSGPGLFSGVSGIVLRGGGSKVSGLVIHGFAAAISLEVQGMNTLEGNFIGTDSLGSVARPNRWGVNVQSSNNTIGGTNAAARNVISCNSQSGIFLTGATATNNHILGNYLGTSASGNVDITNGCGVWLDAPGNFIGGGSANERNIILGGANPAVYLPAGNAGGNTIQGNYIGTNAAGTVGLGAAGVYVLTPNNIITNNVISGNRGVFFQEAIASGNIIQGNLVGLSADGTTALSNNTAGIDLLRVSHTLIGGTSAEDRNVIAVRNHGVSITGGDSNIVLGNYIGTNAAGTIGVVSGGSAGSGVFIIASANNLIGGTTAEAGNVISNSATGVVVTGGATGNIIQGNLIGTNATGTGAIGNITRGIAIATPQGSTLTRDNIIGGTVAGAGNLISGNSGPGVYVVGANANTIQGNLIGLSANGTSPLPNASDGIQFGSGDSNLIGGFLPDAANRIAFNGVGFPNSRANGIKMFDGIGNQILGNSIFANERLGIDLVGGTENALGVTANDSCDTDAGPNNLQNYPVLTSAIPGTGQVTIQGTLNGNSYNTYLIQFFSSSTRDTSGYGGGRDLLGSTYVTTGSNCIAAFDVTLPVTVPLGQYITSTATNAASSTSEFSLSIASGTTSVSHLGSDLPKTFALMQNYPNPFNPTTQIRFALPVDSRVRVAVYSILGQEVRTLANEQSSAGYFTVEWNGESSEGNRVSSGVYFYRMEATPQNGEPVFVSLKKMLFLK
jgi:parallel beta-helix repeat protein